MPGPVASQLLDPAKGVPALLSMYTQDPGNNVSIILEMYSKTAGFTPQSLVFTMLANECGGDTTFDGVAYKYSLALGDAARSILGGNFAGWRESVETAIEVLQAS